MSTPPIQPRWQRLAGRLRALWRSPAGTVLMVLCVLAGAHLWQTRHLPSGQVPDVVLQLSSGESTTLAAWRARHPGQPVALHVWAEWCPICSAEEHNITRLQADWPVMTIAMQSGGTAQVQRLLGQRGLAWPTAVDESGALARSLGVQSVPALLVLDAQGRLRAASVGYTSKLGMRARLWWARAAGIAPAQDRRSALP